MVRYFVFLIWLFFGRRYQRNRLPGEKLVQRVYHKGLNYDLTVLVHSLLSVVLKVTQ